MKSRSLFVLGLMGLSLLSNTTFANDNVKIKVAKQAIQSMQVRSYASPALKNLIGQMEKVEKQIEPEMGCEMPEGFFMGYGNGGAGASRLQATVLKNGVVRATWIEDWGDRRYGDKKTVDFDMTCQGNRCVIEDVRVIFKPNDVHSLKKSYKKVIKYRQCF